MNTLIKTAIVTSALFASALSVHANSYDDAVTKGQIMHPNGTAGGSGK